jgi:hypothetical protein
MEQLKLNNVIMLEIEIIQSNEYAKFLQNLKEKVCASQQRAVLQVNQQLILLYHHIETEIICLQKDLKSHFPEMKGFNTRNLKYMRQFANKYPDSEFVQQVAAQWFHLVTIFSLILEKAIPKNLQFLLPTVNEIEAELNRPR